MSEPRVDACKEIAPLRDRHQIYLGLGSNMGERHAQLAMALQHLRAHMEFTALSSLYETEPVGYLEQPPFLNLVCAGLTILSAPDLLRQNKAIEQTMGRETTFRNGPRPIDIDILFYDDLRLSQEGLIIPHPRLAERAFVLIPLAEIAPDLVDPVSGQQVHKLLTGISQAGVVRQAKQLQVPLAKKI